LLFLACFIFKIRATLDFKNKNCALGNNRLISPSYLLRCKITYKLAFFTMLNCAKMAGGNDNFMERYILDIINVWIKKSSIIGKSDDRAMK
jgi:hypothetical protein